MAHSAEKIARRLPLGGRRPSSNDYCYLAGLFDGEGSIDVLNGTSPRLKISMTDGPTLYWLGHTFGGRVYYEKASGSARQAAWRWNLLQRRDVAAVIRGMLPYLKLKRARCLCALDAIAVLESGDRSNLSATLERVRARSHTQRYYPGTGPLDPRPTEQPPDEVSA